ncbi:Carbon-nitrogen hydrolase, partial [Trinorchestia longiramus]
MYLVVDLAEQAPCDTSVAPCQTDDLSFFNTQVVFDRIGQVIARYRKQNLYLEPQFAPGPSDDASAIFTTDFGVKFSLQVCFDITFLHPGYSNAMNEGVRDIVMSTAWVDENPFLLAISVQNGWSRGLGVNLIVSGYHWPERTKLGSGVFRGYSDLTSSYTFNPNSGNVVIIQPVTTCRSASASRSSRQALSEPRFINVAKTGFSELEKREHVILHEDLSVYERTSLSTTQAGESKVLTQCSNDGLCCRIEYEHSSSNLTYQLLTYSGIVKKG